MTLFKLSLRNLKKSMHNYIIYFVTLILGVAIFYVFNTLGDQTVMMNLSETTRDILGFVDEAMSAVSVFVACVLGFLVVYANTFLMKRRKKEFGVYMLLGMSKAKISGILVIETVMIGLISLAVGLAFGVVAAQGMSIFVVNLFEADMTSFQFRIEMDAIVKTLIYFLVMYVIVIIFDLIVVGKSKLITLMQSTKKGQKNYSKNPVVCLFVFLLAAVLLGTAYYKVTRLGRGIMQFSDLGVQILKGVIGTFLLFWSISGFFLFFIKRNKRFYFKGLNAFSTKELSSRINTTVFSGGVICLLLFFTICILSSAVSIKRNLERNLELLVPVDVQFEVLYDKNISETYLNSSLYDVLRERNYPLNQLTDCTEYDVYIGPDVKLSDIFSNVEGLNDIDMSLDCMKISDYNRMRESFGKETVSIEPDSYIVLANYSEVVQKFNTYLPEASSITVGSVCYKPMYDHVVDGFVEIAETESNSGIILFPDDVDFSNRTFIKRYMSANYANQEKQARRNLDEKIYESNRLIEVDEISDDYQGASVVGYGSDGELEDCYIDIMIATKNSIFDASVGISALSVFVGTYLGVIFLISSGAILALKELSEATDNKEKYQVLRRLGVDEKQIHRSLFAQCSVFFALPFVIGLLHSFFGMKAAKIILTIFGKANLLSSAAIAIGIILVIYGIYFSITYVCCKKIISE